MGEREERLKVLDINLKLVHAQAIDRLEEMVDGCKAVRELKESSKDTRELATFVIRDCNRLIATLRGERFPGDDT
jgi:hypothetical protein